MMVLSTTFNNYQQHWVFRPKINMGAPILDNGLILQYWCMLAIVVDTIPGATNDQ